MRRSSASLPRMQRPSAAGATSSPSSQAPVPSSTKSATTERSTAAKCTSVASTGSMAKRRRFAVLRSTSSAAVSWDFVTMRAARSRSPAPSRGLSIRLAASVTTAASGVRTSWDTAATHSLRASSRCFHELRESMRARATSTMRSAQKTAPRSTTMPPSSWEPSVTAYFQTEPLGEPTTTSLPPCRQQDTG